MSDADPRKSFGFRRRVGLARAAAAFEALWPALWPALGVVGLFLSVSLFGVWMWLPVWLHALGLAAFAGALVWTLWRARRALVWPDREAGLGRLERVNALGHQPLRSLGDRLSGGGDDAGTLSLWQRHRERLLSAMAGLRVGAPRSGLPRLDPWALRAALLLVLIVAVTAAGSLAPERLSQAFALQRPGGTGEVPVELTVWVTPPAYTGRPPLRLVVEPPPAGDGSAPRAPSSVSVPEGSEALAQLHHLSRPAAGFALALDDERQTFDAVGESSAEARLVLERSGRLAVGDARDDLGVWDIEAVPDVAPEIAFGDEPGATHRGVLRVGFNAGDDYGLTSIALLMSRPSGGGEKSERMELMRPANGSTEVDDAAYLDLTPHPWAGLPVTLQLEAVDGVDQRGRSETIEVVLPARQFQHPLARAIIEQRRELARAPEQREEVAASLNRMSLEPRLYQYDPAVLLALRSAVERLRLNDDEASLEDVLSLLWDTALHLEDGSLSLAERELRELQEAIRRALAEDASDEELERLLDELERAMQEYLDALARQAQEMAQNQQPTPIDPDAMQIQRQDLQQMLDQVREMLRTGSREAAREMLAQLQEMLENLQVAQQGQMQQGQQQLSQLQEMIQRQQGLLDQTFDLSRRQGREGLEGQQGQPGQQGQMQQGQQGQMGQGRPGQMRPGQGQQGGQSGQLAMDQEALRRALGELMRGIGESGMSIPRALGEAELAMRDARDALQGGQPGQATDPQAQAIDQLRQGGQAMLQEMQRMLGQGQGEGQGEVAGQPFGPNPDNRDPLGRSLFNQGGADLYGERVPTELDLGKARAILEELYRRAGERERPADELEYLERLLRRF